MEAQAAGDQEDHCPDRGDAGEAAGTPLGGPKPSDSNQPNAGAGCIRSCYATQLTYRSDTIAIFCAAMAVKPRTSGPANSLLFFGKVQSLKPPDRPGKWFLP